MSGLKESISSCRAATASHSQQFITLVLVKIEIRFSLFKFEDEFHVNFVIISRIYTGELVPRWARIVVLGTSTIRDLIVSLFSRLAASYLNPK